MNSIQILTAARSTKSSRLFFILEVPMAEHGRLQKRAFAGDFDQPLKEVEISDICELRDGTILAKTSMGKIRIPSRISRFEGNVGRSSVKTLSARELIALSVQIIDDRIYINQPIVKTEENTVMVEKQKIVKDEDVGLTVEASEEDIYQISPRF